MRTPWIKGFVVAVVGLFGCSGGGDSSVQVQRSSSALTSVAPAAARYAVKMKDMAKGKAAVQAAGGQVVLELKNRNVVAAKMSAQAAAALAKNPNIQYVEADPERKPLSIWNDDPGDPTATEIVPYGIKMVEADQLAQSGAATNVTVCIIDSGYYAAHPDLRDQTGQGVTVVGYSGVADTDNDPSTDPTTDWYSDKDSHGSHVAGTIAAMTNGIGVVGVLPQGVNLAIVKVFDDDGIWGFEPYLPTDPLYGTELALAVDKCRELRDGIDPTQKMVISMSLGGAAPSSVEEEAFTDAYTLYNALPIAAAGNDGNASMSYPASYDSVMSVAAVDADEAVTDFSQYNTQVEIAAPGKHVLSTVSYFAEAKVTVNGTDYFGKAFPEAPSGTASGALVSAGLCDYTPVGRNKSIYKGKIVLCERGSITFAEKVENAVKGGAAAVIVYNNLPEGFSGTLGEYASPVPAVAMSGTDGATLVGLAGASATLRSTFLPDTASYAYYDGTSMATPHVSGVAALVWSRNITAKPSELRRALRETAVFPGTDGKAIDVHYGFGIVKAAQADAYLGSGGSCSCDDGDPCTWDRCDADGGCVTAPLCTELKIDSLSPNEGTQGQSLTITVNGTGMELPGSVDFGESSGISISSATWFDSTKLEVAITISTTATPGPRTFTFAHTDGGDPATVLDSATATFTVKEAPQCKVKGDSCTSGAECCSLICHPKKGTCL